MNLGNECAPCCGVEPTLRLREKPCFKSIIPYVQFECPKCGAVGGLGLFEGDAKQMWQQIHEVEPLNPLKIVVLFGTRGTQKCHLPT